MQHPVTTTLTLGLAMLLLLAMPTVVGWHSEDESLNQRFASPAGDVQYETESAECRAAAPQGVDCVVLYGHMRNLLPAAPLNAQRPPDCAPDIASGFTGTPGIEPFWAFSRQVLYSSPGFVEYNPSDCDGQPRVHPERGLNADLRLSPEVDLKGYWYLSADALEFSPIGLNTPGGSDTGIHAGTLPCVTVEMTVQTGRFVGYGKEIAHGRTTQTILTVPEDFDASGLPALPDPCPGAQGVITPGPVTEFEVNLGRTPHEISKHEGFIVSVNWYQHNYGSNAPNEESYIIQREWNLHVGPEHAPRVVLPVEPTLQSDLTLEEEDGVVTITAEVLSTLGSYDVDDANARLRLHDAAGNPVETTHLLGPSIAQNTDHGGHFKPVRFTWEWNAALENLPAGSYELRFTASNWQHTSQATAQVQYTVAPGSGAAAPLAVVALEAPAAPLLLLVAALAGPAAAARRRR